MAVDTCQWIEDNRNQCRFQSKLIDIADVRPTLRAAVRLAKPAAQSALQKVTCASPAPSSGGFRIFGHSLAIFLANFVCVCVSLSMIYFSSGCRNCGSIWRGLAPPPPRHLAAGSAFPAISCHFLPFSAIFCHFLPFLPKLGFFFCCCCWGGVSLLIFDFLWRLWLDLKLALWVVTAWLTPVSRA